MTATQEEAVVTYRVSIFVPVAECVHAHLYSCVSVCVCACACERAVNQPELTSVHVSPNRVSSNRARTQKETVKIRNLGLGTIYKNEIRSRVNLDNSSLGKKRNYVGNTMMHPLNSVNFWRWAVEQRERASVCLQEHFLQSHVVVY